jgi:hypothetical protein
MVIESTPKILYFGTPTTGLDYLSDSVFHGLRQLLGNNVVDADKLHYMYDSYENLSALYGRGFTLPGRLPDIEVDRTDIEHKIKSRYFDFIIYGAPYVQDGLRMVDIVQSHYPSNKIIFMNGNDSSYEGQQNPPNIDGIHFLRERFSNDTTIPISFSIPKENIVSEVSHKQFYLMPLIPNVYETYRYNTEQEYYDMYNRSMFGLTWKKAGWDCMRHYEILSQGCIPLFLDIANLPATMMTWFPKTELKHILNVAVRIPNYSMHREFKYQNSVLQQVNFADIEFNDPDTYGYYDIANGLLQYTKEYLTTEYSAKYVLDIVNRFQ